MPALGEQQQCPGRREQSLPQRWQPPLQNQTACWCKCGAASPSVVCRDCFSPCCLGCVSDVIICPLYPWGALEWRGHLSLQVGRSYLLCIEGRNRKCFPKATWGREGGGNWIWSSISSLVSVDDSMEILAQEIRESSFFCSCASVVYSVLLEWVLLWNKKKTPKNKEKKKRKCWSKP